MPLLSGRSDFAESGLPEALRRSLLNLDDERITASEVPPQTDVFPSYQPEASARVFDDACRLSARTLRQNPSGDGVAPCPPSPLAPGSTSWA